MMPRLSVCVLVCDEEAQLPRCLDSVAWADELVVLVDAKSADGSEKIAREPAERFLVEQDLLHAVEHGPGAVLDPATPEIDQGARLGRRWRAGDAFAHEQGEGIGKRRLGAVRQLAEAAPLVALLDAGGEVGGDARHGLGADRFDAGLLDCLEHVARLPAAGGEIFVQAVVMFCPAASPVS